MFGHFYPNIERNARLNDILVMPQRTLQEIAAVEPLLIRFISDETNLLDSNVQIARKRSQTLDSANTAMRQLQERKAVLQTAAQGGVAAQATAPAQGVANPVARALSLG